MENLTEILKTYKNSISEHIDFIGKSRQLKHLQTQVEEYGQDRLPVTIVGPVGSGRNTLAKSVHFSSSDWWRTFHEIELSGKDYETAVNILFGYTEEHIFAAPEYIPGLFTEAKLSTLCFRNFDKYSKNTQKTIYETHSSGEYKDVRFIFTMASDPDDLNELEYIDDNIYNMITGRVITIPSLSKRKDDVIPLAEKFIRDCASEFGIKPKKLSKEAERWLRRAPWNANITQLKRVVYYACFNTEDKILYPHHFALAHDRNVESYQEKQLEEVSIQGLVEKKLESFLARLGRFEANHLHEAIISRVEEPLIRLIMNKTNGNQIKASRMLGINRNTLRTKLNKYKIKIERKGEKG